MKALAIMFFLGGVIALFASARPDIMLSRSESVAMNYAVYRNAVNTAVLNDHTLTGIVANSRLSLPSGWLPVRAWTNRVEGSRCYVYGIMDSGEFGELKSMFSGSMAIGRKINGNFISGSGSSTALPAYIPDNSVVSMVEVR